MNQVVIYRKRFNNSGCISFSEFGRLVNSYPYGSRFRVMWLLSLCCLARPYELCSLKTGQISNDFKYIRLLNAKRKKIWRNDTLVVTIEEKPLIKLPDCVADELKVYYNLNKHTFRNGYVFGCATSSLRKILSVARSKLGGSFKDVWYTVDDGITKTFYRINCYSFRRTMATYLYLHYKHTGYDAIQAHILVSKRHLLHQRVRTTDSHYLFMPEDIGLTVEDLNIPFEDLLKKYVSFVKPLCVRDDIGFCCSDCQLSLKLFV